MGAEVFCVYSNGKTAKEAFDYAVENALHEYGHAGYTGTIAEKHKFVQITPPYDIASREQAIEYAESLIDEDDRRIRDKWGPAGCIRVGDTDGWVFFGMASS